MTYFVRVARPSLLVFVCTTYHTNIEQVIESYASNRTQKAKESKEHSIHSTNKFISTEFIHKLTKQLPTPFETRYTAAKGLPDRNRITRFINNITAVKSTVARCR